MLMLAPSGKMGSLLMEAQLCYSYDIYVMSQHCISYAGMSKQIKGPDLPVSQSFGFFCLVTHLWVRGCD